VKGIALRVSSAGRHCCGRQAAERLGTGKNGLCSAERAWQFNIGVRRMIYENSKRLEKNR
jgi:hypothetical protein